LKLFPLNGDLPSSNIWKINPKENTSDIGWLFTVKSFILTISGATNPGVPHLV
jgi:hypothetical protein